MTDIKSFLLDWKVLLMIFMIIIALLALQPKINTSGAQVVYISPNTALGNYTTSGRTTLNTGSIITAINNKSVSNPQQFYAYVNKLNSSSIVTINYKNEVFPYIYLPSSVTFLLPNKTQLNSTYLQLSPVSPTNLIYGLDIVGGTELDVVPNTTSYNSTTLSTLENILNTRLNVYGISGVSISTVTSLSGKDFISISMPNIGEAEALSLINNQGQFYASINGKTIFNSSDPSETILTVCLTSSCPYGGMQAPTLQNGIYQFSFGVEISRYSAERFANVTSNLSIVAQDGQMFLSKPIALFLNGKNVMNLSISSNLKGKPEQSVLITGSGATYDQAESQMKLLQAIMQSGSLPVPIKIVSISSVSSQTSVQFIDQIYVLLFVAFAVVASVAFIRYRDKKIALLIFITSVSEIFIVIGIAALIRWTLDVPSIAGIIASIGVSVDDQIIITDE
ncbi:MAG: hypothetical protein RAK22_02250, partial [Nanoarchaeota archaeon]|nr:hypothetical protein [Nanoarchaeota archaeon]